MKAIESRLRALGAATLAGMLRGIEKESLRVRRDGTLAATPHPPGLGSALTHPRITTDFSEAQLELITAPHASAAGCLEELTRIHELVYRHIDKEILWAASMPCTLPAEEAIPIARYGSSNIGRLKTVYRVGLSHRYGRRMQMISGIHYNFSLPAAAWAALGSTANEGYFALIRNFRRHSWLLLYLLGASPAVCASFVAGRTHKLQALSEDTLYLPHATSLRMGRLGYQSDAQASLGVSYNSLERYASSLESALTTPYRPYEAIGVRDGEGYRQLAPTLIQIENEFYGTIRPKRTIASGERPLHALRERGVEYVEVRLLDLDPFSPIGIAEPALRLLDVFLLHCALADSAADTDHEIEYIRRNQHRVSERGRERGLRLDRRGSAVALRDWGLEVLDDCGAIAEALDAEGGSAHRDALGAATAALRDPDATPSARVLAEMSRHHGNSHARFALARSLAHAGALVRPPADPDTLREDLRIAEATHAEQRRLEAADTLPFETFRERYLSPTRLSI